MGAALEIQRYTDVRDVNFAGAGWKAKVLNQSVSKVKLKVASNSTGQVIRSD